MDLGPHAEAYWVENLKYIADKFISSFVRLLVEVSAVAEGDSEREPGMERVAKDS